LSPWRRRGYVPPKRLFLQEPHGVTSHKTPFYWINRSQNPRELEIIIRRTWRIKILLKQYYLSIVSKGDRRESRYGDKLYVERSMRVPAGPRILSAQRRTD
jgi:hypothetical protein